MSALVTTVIVTAAAVLTVVIAAVALWWNRRDWRRSGPSLSLDIQVHYPNEADLADAIEIAVFNNGRGGIGLQRADLLIPGGGIDLTDYAIPPTPQLPTRIDGDDHIELQYDLRRIAAALTDHGVQPKLVRIALFVPPRKPILSDLFSFPGVDARGVTVDHAPVGRSVRPKMYKP